MFKIPFDLQIRPKCLPKPLPHIKIKYLQQTLQDYQDKYNQICESLLVNKQLLKKSLQTIQSLKLNHFNQLSLFENSMIAKLQQQNEKLRKQIQKQRNLRDQQKCKLLIFQQIQQEETIMHRQIINQYQQKIRQLRFSIQDKEHHIQLIQQNGQQPKYKSPSKNIMNLIQNYDNSQCLIQQYKQQNEGLLKKLNTIQLENWVNNIQHQNLKQQLKKIKQFKYNNSQTTNESQIAQIKTENEELLRVLSQNKQNNPINSKGESNKTRLKFIKQNPKNQSLFSKIVILYHKEKTNFYLLNKKYNLLLRTNQQLNSNLKNLISSNHKLNNKIENLLQKSRKKNSLNQIKPIRISRNNQNSFKSNFPTKNEQNKQNNEYLKQLHEQFQQLMKIYQKKIFYKQTENSMKSLSHNFIRYQDQQNQEVEKLQISQIKPECVTYSQYCLKPQSQDQNSIFQIFN